MTRAIPLRFMVRYWLVPGVALFGGADCVRAVSTVTPAPAPAPARAPSVPAAALSRLADTVWYISKRTREQGRDTRRFADSLKYRLAVHTYRRSVDVLVDALDLEVADSVAISRSEYVQGIRAATEITASDDFAVLLVHGFGTSFRECVRYASESRIRSRSGVPWVAFCWPSNGTGFAPPSRGAILDCAYRSDSAVAVESQPAFGRAAGVMLDAVPASRLMLVSHSLGAQLMAGALGDSTALRVRFAREGA